MSKIPDSFDSIKNFVTPAISILRTGLRAGFTILFGLPSKKSEATEVTSETTGVEDKITSSSLATDLKKAQDDIAEVLKEQGKRTPENIKETEIEKATRAETDAMQAMQVFSAEVLTIMKMESQKQENPPLKLDPTIKSAAPQAESTKATREQTPKPLEKPTPEKPEPPEPPQSPQKPKP